MRWAIDRGSQDEAGLIVVDADGCKATVVLSCHGEVAEWLAERLKLAEELEREYMATMGRLGDAHERIRELENERDSEGGIARARLAAANMRLTAMERERDSARRVARAAYVVYLASVEDISGTRPCSLKVCNRPMCVAARAYKRVLAEEARREKGGG